MSSERLERISSKAPGATLSPATKTTEPEQLPCPRCDSTNTKFCYYNNYNLSQPRHFCKSCRRYWTRGGTLRNVPIGGGTRRSSSSNKRPRTDSSTSIIPTVMGHHEVLNSVPLNSGNFGGNFHEMNLNEALPESGGFSSLLSGDMHAAAAGSVFYGMPGRYVGPGSGFYGMGFGGLNMFDFPMEAVRDGGNTWQMSAIESGGLNDGNSDNFGWPDLAISTQGKSLK